MFTCTSIHSFLSKSYLFPGLQTYFFPTPGSASAFWSQGIHPFLGSGCSSCFFVEVTKWMCLKFRLISKTRAVSPHQQVTVAPGKDPKLQEFFSWADACLDRPLIPTELQPPKYCCSQPHFLQAQMFHLPAGMIGLWSSPAVGLVIPQSRGSCWPKWCMPLPQHFSCKHTWIKDRLWMEKDTEQCSVPLSHGLSILLNEKEKKKKKRK